MFAKDPFAEGPEGVRIEQGNSSTKNRISAPEEKQESRQSTTATGWKINGGGGGETSHFGRFGSVTVLLIRLV